MRWLLVVAVILAGFFWWRFQTTLPVNPRLTLAVVGDPVVIWSWNREDDSWVIIKIPADWVIPAAKGYGRYSLTSLWKLDGIDKQKGSLFTQSLSEILGVPVYLESNLALDLRLRFWLAQRALDKEKATTLDLAQNVTVTETLPDGSTINVLDLARLDLLLGNIFELTGIRKESLTAAVYNTGKIQGAGEKIARKLSRLGVLVIFVGNKVSADRGCIIAGPGKVLQSLTARVVKEILSCAAAEEPISGQGADFEVRIGS